MANCVARDWHIFQAALFSGTAVVTPQLRKATRRSFYAGYGAAALGFQELLDTDDTDALVAHMKRTTLEMNNFIDAIQRGEV